MLSHGLYQHLKEEPRVVHELANDQLVSLGRSEDGLEVMSQLFMDCPIFGTCCWFCDKYVLKIQLKHSATDQTAHISRILEK